MSKYLLPYGWLGLSIIITSEILLFSGNIFVGTWMTPLAWTGYILFMDNLVFGLSGSSMVRESGSQIFAIALISIVSWLIFEGYNVYLKNWHYINLPENRTIRYVGYAWSFATITPGILLTKDFLAKLKLFESISLKKVKVSGSFLKWTIFISGLLLLYPLFFPNEYLFPLVWCSVIFLVDPINYFLGGKSLTEDLINGKLSTVIQLLSSGFICGVLWEFWNYWAYAKWIYTVPYFPDYKIFEMPVAGFLGFPPFALECYVLYQFFKNLSGKLGLNLRYD